MKTKLEGQSKPKGRAGIFRSEPALSTLTSLEHEANLHPLGRFLLRIHLWKLLDAQLAWIARYDAPANKESTESKGKI
jgi:hypothetical protein